MMKEIEGEEGKSLSNDAQLILYLFIVLCVLMIVFFPLKLLWINDPFQKIILAPLGEEPLKLIVAFTIWFAVFQGMKALKIRQWKLSDSFLHHFPLYAIIAGIALGFGEGSLGNIYLHAASSLIGALLIVFVFLKVKEKPWKIGYRLTLIIITLGIPMFIHSLSNQFAYIFFTNVNPQYQYLVIIGRYFHDNTIFTDASRFDTLMVVIAGIFITLWYLYLFFQREKRDASPKVFDVRVILGIGIIFGLVLILLKMYDFLSYNISMMILSVAILIALWYLYLFFQREKRNASKKIFSFRIIFAIGIVFGLYFTFFSMNEFLKVILFYYLHPAFPIGFLLGTIVNEFFVPILFILIAIVGLLLTRKPLEKSDTPKIKWGFRTLFLVGIIFAVYELSGLIENALKYYIPINAITVSFFVWPFYFILIAIAGLVLTKGK